MPCGNPRTVAQALQHVWVTDEILAQAFHRIARVSHAHRRHGSNVPGPLEARRRSSKRRMGMESIGHGAGPPPGADFGSLFGLGRATPPPDFERGWKWEAPIPRPLREEPERADLQRHGTDEQATYQPYGTTEAQKVQDFLKLPPDPIDRSKEAFEAHLERLENVQTLEQSDIQALVAFLDSPSNEPEAHLTLRLFQWLETKSNIEERSWLAIKRSIMSRARESDIHVEELVKLFMYLIYDRPDECILGSSTDKREQISAITSWLSHVWPARDLGVLEDNVEDPWNAVYELLAQRFEPSDFPEHFGDMLRDRFGWALLRHWVPRFTASANVSAPDSSAEDTAREQATMFAMKTFKRFQPHDPQLSNVSVDAQAVHEAFSKLPRHDAYVLNGLIDVLSRKGLPYHQVVAQIVDVYIATQPNSTTKNLFINLRRRKTNQPVPLETATELMQHFLASGLPVYALYVFESLPSIPLRICYDLPVKLIEEAPQIHQDRIWRILCRSTSDDKVPLELRWRKRNALTPEHVETVHKVAYAWASSTYISPRMAFRRVWECFRFLNDRSAPISPMLSRAMVKAGIIRPLQETRRLSKAQVRYVIGVIEGVEGEGTAVEVDRMVFEHWNLVLQAKGYRPGIRQDQDGKYWLHNRQLWQKDWMKRVPPPKAIDVEGLPGRRLTQHYMRVQTTELEQKDQVTFQPFASSEPLVSADLSNDIDPPGRHQYKARKSARREARQRERTSDGSVRIVDPGGGRWNTA
ncbi:uncharacterized protein LTR77_003057 [Saxophila tyrrhenica]|uniref:Uncharacterized protein n=1 Tax=Saxophila tyrrhenica TaxID=1690608 RepID=A0AAV9PKW5_9PEZI|nr:hypothetical protein LTR77_003057 [Saxophila tyrrhenica]